jgi:predicted metal-dependent phosphoesterase TrpH
MIYKTDTHMHTAESSECSEVAAEELVRLYHQQGYKTLIITPHYNSVYLRRVSDDWNERINYMFVGYNKAKALGDTLGVNVLYGIELTLRSTSSDYLIYGITPEFLKENHDLYDYSLEQLIFMCRENDFLIVQAHPFRSGNELVPPMYKMPIEVYNGNYYLDPRNDMAKAYAEKHGLIGISGSDFHFPQELGRGGIITKHEIKTIDHFIDTVLCNNFEIIET